MIINNPTNDQIPLLASLWREAFEDGEFFDNVFRTSAFATERCRCAMLGDDIAGALYWFDCSCRGEKVAYLYAIATAQKYRSQGICHALMEDTHDHLRSLGYKSAILVPGSKGLFDFYGGMGYSVCSSVCEREFIAGEENIEVKRIDQAEYAKERRIRLPDDSVVQDGENLRLLEKMASFYVGQDFLMAASVEGDTLICHELLGDVDAAPMIVKSLGCARGRFRYPGNDKSFAMCILLDESSEIPEYFGIAFD